MSFLKTSGPSLELQRAAYALFEWRFTQEAQEEEVAVVARRHRLPGLDAARQVLVPGDAWGAAARNSDQ